MEQLDIGPEAMGLGWLALFIIIALLAMALFHRRYGLGPRGASKLSLRMVGSLPLGDKRAIVIVEAEQEKMLLGITSQNVNLLCRLPRQSRDDREEIEAPPLPFISDGRDGSDGQDGSRETKIGGSLLSASGKFGSLLRQAISRGRLNS